MTKDNLILAIIYLWTRDGQFPVNKETEGYIADHIRKIKESGKPIFSDQERAEMASRILKEI